MPFAGIGLAITMLAAAQVLAGINTVPIAAYGLRSYLLHLPLIVIMARTLKAADLRAVGRCILLLSVPMAGLMAVQFYAPATSWLNSGPGDAGQMLSMGGHVRPAGTFSFGTGAQCFVILAEAFLIYGLTNRKVYSNWVLWPAIAATAAAIPLSGSRTVLFLTVLMFAFAMVSGLASPTSLVRLLRTLLVVALVYVAVAELRVFQDATSVLSARFQEASNTEGGLQDVLELRVLGVFGDGITATRREDWLGQGVGMGSNVAAVLKTGSMGFLLAEMEWARVVLEMGPIVGVCFILFRCLLCGQLVLSAMKVLMRRRYNLAWLLVPATVPLLIMTTMEQPTNLGFMILGAGFCAAAAERRAPLRQVCLSPCLPGIAVQARG
jgi:hypothetical protein